MPFLEDIQKYNSLSIVGLAKNTGKTECLNYVLSRLKNTQRQIALTSIGLDGERNDQVTQTSKPEIELNEGMFFVTSETHYAKRNLVSEVLQVSTQTTSLGRLVTAKAIHSGKVILSGPPDSMGIVKLISELKARGVDLTIVDGALSRKSLASPAVTEAMILATGAAVSANLSQLVFKTHYVYNLIQLPEVEPHLKQKLQEIKQGIWAIDSLGRIVDTGLSSALSMMQKTNPCLQHASTLFVSGAVTEHFLEFLKNQKQIEKIRLIVRDFTKIFSSAETYYAFVKKGGKISVLNKTKLLALTINPTSPNHYKLNSHKLKQALEDRLQVPVYDVRKMEYAVS